MTRCPKSNQNKSVLKRKGGGTCSTESNRNSRSRCIKDVLVTINIYALTIRRFHSINSTDAACTEQRPALFARHSQVLVALTFHLRTDAMLFPKS